MIQNIILPKQGLQMTEGFITRWLHKEGDRIRAGEPLFEMETDKLVITIDAAYSGTLLKILYPEGSTVPITTVIAYVGEEGDSIPEAPVPAAPENEVPAAVPAEPRAEQPKAPAKRAERLFATPRAKTTAAEHGVDLRGIVPSGPDGLIIERDVLAHMRGAGGPISGAAAYAERRQSDACLLHRGTEGGIRSRILPAPLPLCGKALACRSKIRR